MKKIASVFLTGCFAFGFSGFAFADGGDYHGQELKEKNFTKQKLDGADFTDAVLNNSNFTGASLKKANFKDADLSGVWLNDADLTGANLSGVKGSYLSSRSHFDGANLQGGYLHSDNSTFRGANLRDTKVSGYIYNCDFTGADFSGANLRLMAVNTDSNKWKGVIYDDDTSWPDGFDPVAKGAVLKTQEKKTASTNDAPATARPTPATTTASDSPQPPGTSMEHLVNPFTAVEAAPSVEGKYIGESNPNAWCQLNADGSLIFHEGGQEMKGTYEVHDGEVSMKIAGGVFKSKLDGNTLLPPGGKGQKLIKQAAANDITGKYVGETNPEIWCDLKADGTLLFHEAHSDMKGTYKVQGNDVTLNIAGEVINIKIDGNKLLPPNGGHAQKLVKQ